MGNLRVVLFDSVFNADELTALFSIAKVNIMSLSANENIKRLKT